MYSSFMQYFDKHYKLSSNNVMTCNLWSILTNGKVFWNPVITGDDSSTSGLKSRFKDVEIVADLKKFI